LLLLAIPEGDSALSRSASVTAIFCTPGAIIRCVDAGSHFSSRFPAFSLRGFVKKPLQAFGAACRTWVLSATLILIGLLVYFLIKTEGLRPNTLDFPKLFLQSSFFVTDGLTND